MPIRTLLTWSLLALTLGCQGQGHEGEPADEPGSVAIAAVQGPALFVVNGGGRSISVVDPLGLAVEATIRLTNVAYPHHINLSPDATQMLVADPGEDLSEGHGGHGEAVQGALLLLDARTGETLAARRLPAANHNGLFAADAIWTTQMGDPGALLMLDPRTLATRAEIPVGAMPMEVTASADGHYLFVANGGSDDVTVVDAASRSVVTTIAVGYNPVGAWPGADNVMYVDNEQEGTISAIDVASLAVVQTFELGFMPGMAALAPAGDELWVTDAEHGAITFWSLATGQITGAVSTGAGAHGIAFAPDGKTAFITNQHANSLSVIDVATRTIAATLTMDGEPNGLAFRP